MIGNILEKELADATVKTFGNGSHQFIGEAVPALLDSGIARDLPTLKKGIQTLVSSINYNGEGEFSNIAALMRSGKIKNLRQIRERYL